MIASVRGRVAAVGLNTAVVEVGGVGLVLQCTPNTLATLTTGKEARLATSMVVREDSLSLFAFGDDDERALFDILQTASGVGPKLAQAMLAVHGPDALRRAVASEDLGALTKVPGIGRKGAQRVVLELKDRIGAAGSPPGRDATAPAVVGQQRWRDQVHQALLGLGWSSREAESAVSAVAEQAGDDPDVSVLLRAALRTLAKS
ncbi:MAG: Holliday junction branch migration protein RuvA [Nocardioidaceae bacterium]